MAKRRPPRRGELNEWTKRELEQVRAFIDDELHERESQEREKAWAMHARTVTHTRFALEKVRCGKPGCHCAAGGELHGPYWYKIETLGSGKTRKKYVGKKRPAGAREPLRQPFV